MYGGEPDSDKITCEHCGESYYPEIGPPSHICAAGLAANRAERERYERAYKGSGKAIRVTIQFECLDSELAATSALGMAEMSDLREAIRNKGVVLNGSDEILQCRWAVKVERV